MYGGDEELSASSSREGRDAGERGAGTKIQKHSLGLFV